MAREILPVAVEQNYGHLGPGYGLVMLRESVPLSKR